MPQPSLPADRPLFLLHASVAVLDGQRLLLVQEAKAASRGRWNLPGGHVDHGEALATAAARELREETSLDLPLDGLLGIYQSHHAVRFVYLATLRDTQPRPGDEVLAVR